MKQLLIYEKPLALDRTKHTGVFIRPELGGYGFARSLNSVPLTAAEFSQASRDFPIVFAGEGDDISMPAVLLGLSQDENLFVQADGSWDAQAYVPAFLRRYPFVVANQENSTDDFTVCVDESFLTTAEEGGVRLFEESGEDAPALSRAISFLADYQQAVRRTQDLVAQVREHKLAIPRTVKVERPGSEPRTLSGFSVIDEARLQKLGGKALDKLSRSGSLGLLYIHLMSLHNVQRLSARLDARRD